MLEHIDQKYGEIFYDRDAKGRVVNFGKAKNVKYTEEWISKWGAIGGSFDTPQSWDAFWNMLQAVSGIIDENTNPIGATSGNGPLRLPSIPDTVPASFGGDHDQFEIHYGEDSIIWGNPTSSGDTLFIRIK